MVQVIDVCVEDLQHDRAVDDLKLAARLDELRCDFEEAFSIHGLGRVWLVPSIEKKLENYKLLDIEAWDVVTEAYRRATHHVEKGGLIWNLVSWMKSASTYIILEKQRKAKKLSISFTDADLYSQTQDIPTGIEIDVEEAARFLVECIHSLPLLDRKVIILHTIHQQSWKEIQEILAEKNVDISLSALRKRNERALRKIRDKISTWRRRAYYQIFAEDHDLFCRYLNQMIQSEDYASFYSSTK